MSQNSEPHYAPTGYKIENPLQGAMLTMFGLPIFDPGHILEPNKAPTTTPTSATTPTPEQNPFLKLARPEPPDPTSDNYAFNHLVDNVMLGGMLGPAQTPTTPQTPAPPSSQTSIFNTPAVGSSQQNLPEHTTESDAKESIF